MSISLPPKLLDLVRDSVNELFQAAGVSDIKYQSENAAHLALADGDQTYSASLGFSGDQMRGAVVIFAGAELLKATNPQREFVPTLSENDHADWIGEMANQTVGNLKRLVAGYRVEFQLSTPTVVRGRELALAKGAENLRVMWFSVNGQQFKAHFTAELAESVSFEGEPEVVAQAAGGDTMLF
jgi:CheY-specific phosphatase CheX